MVQELDQSNLYTPEAFSHIYVGAWISQSFRCGKNGDLDKVDLYVYKIGNPAEPLIIGLWTESNDVPKEVIMEESFTVEPTSGVLRRFIFSNKARLIAGTKYCIVVRSLAPSTSDCYALEVATTNTGYPDGTIGVSNDQGAYWSTRAFDIPFATYILVVGMWTVSGIITDAKTGNPVADVDVNVDTFFSTKSLADGTYSLTVPESIYNINFSKSGYYTQIFEVVNVTTDITLNVNLQEIPPPPPQITPWSGTLEEGTYEVAVPSNILVGTDTYNFKNWEDLSTSPIRTINLVSGMAINAEYELFIPPPGKGYLQIHAFFNSEEVAADGLIIETGQPFKTPATLEVDPATYTIEITHLGVKKTYSITVTEGQTVRVDAQFAVPTPISPIQAVVNILSPFAIGIIMLALSRRR